MLYPLRFIGVLLLALLLTIFPLPGSLALLRPAWILMIFLFFELFWSSFFSMGLLLLMSLLMDVLLVTPIGMHGVALLLTTWAAFGKARRFHFYSAMQQAILIGVYTGCYQSILYFIDLMLGYKPQGLLVFGSMLVTIFCWPGVKQGLIYYLTPEKLRRSAL